MDTNEEPQEKLSSAQRDDERATIEASLTASDSTVEQWSEKPITERLEVAHQALVMWVIATMFPRGFSSFSLFILLETPRDELDGQGLDPEFVRVIQTLQDVRELLRTHGVKPPL